MPPPPHFHPFIFYFFLLPCLPPLSELLLSPLPPPRLPVAFAPVVPFSLWIPTLPHRESTLRVSLFYFIHPTPIFSFLLSWCCCVYLEYFPTPLRKFMWFPPFSSLRLFLSFARFFCAQNARSTSLQQIYWSLFISSEASRAPLSSKNLEESYFSQIIVSLGRGRTCHVRPVAQTVPTFFHSSHNLYYRTTGPQ